MGGITPENYVRGERLIVIQKGDVVKGRSW